jgi:hypothetical protein
MLQEVVGPERTESVVVLEKLGFECGKFGVLRILELVIGSVRVCVDHTC